MQEELNRKTLNRSIIVLSTVILAAFVAVMGYMVWFQVTQAEAIALRPENARFALKRNEVLRGAILDSRGQPLSYSERTESGGQRRIYQGGPAFAQLLGYVSNQGIPGLEGFMDRILVTDALTVDITRENFLEVLRDPSVGIHRTKEGNNVMTSLDRELQQKAYDLLGDARGSMGSITVLNPMTGEVLAMVNRPSYDPNRLTEEFERIRNLDHDEGVLLNRAARGTYFPGSTFKIVTLAAALEHLPGVEERIFEDRGILDISVGRDLGNINNTAHGDISLKRAFEVSSNVVFGTLAIELGGNRLMETAEAFGFNRSYGLRDMSVETSVFTAYPRNEDGVLARSGIGQNGISTHTLQMALVAGAAANRGFLMEPTVVGTILRADGSILERQEPRVLERAMSEEVAFTVRAYMKSAVDTSGNSNLQQIAAIRGAGKTGTAEDTFRRSDGTVENVVNSWFAGFVPFENPRIAIAVNVVDGGSGAGKAAEIAAELMTWYMENR